MPDGGEQYEEYGTRVANMSFADLLVDLQAQDLGFLGGLRTYLMEVKNHRILRPSRLLAGTEAVVGHAFSPISLKWLSKMATEADKTAIRALTGSNFDWDLAETAPQGTMNATLPSASDDALDPAFVARKQVFHELWLFEMSKLVQAWAESRVDAASGTASFAKADLQGDTDLTAGMQTRSDELVEADFRHAEDWNDWQLTLMQDTYETVELDWVLRFMVYHGMLIPPVGGSAAYTYHAGGGSAGASFDSARDEVARLNGEVDVRLNTRAPSDGLFESTVIPQSLSSSTNEAESGRSFATAIMPLFDRMTSDDPDFRLGTYEDHNWGQFSADIYLVSTPNPAGFWWFTTTMRFFDELAAAANQDDTANGGAGKFAWFALYNDPEVVDEVNLRYGDDHAATAPDHGPAPDHKLHIHLDIRPLTIAPDAQTGYSINANGRLDIP